MINLWHCCLLGCVIGWDEKPENPTNFLNHGSPTITKYQWTWTKNTLENYSVDLNNDDIFFPSWANACSYPWVDTSATSTLSTTGTEPGLWTPIQVERCRPLDPSVGRRMRQSSGPGAICTILRGFNISGLWDAPNRPLIWSPWTRCNRLNPGTSRTSRTDPGKTSRRWRFRFRARAHRRRIRRRRLAGSQTTLRDMICRNWPLPWAAMASCPLRIDASLLSHVCSATCSALYQWISFRHRRESYNTLAQGRITELSEESRKLLQEPILVQDMASSSWSAAAGEPQDEEVRIEPHEPPYGPPPPQNILSLRLSQTIVDALVPHVVHRGAFLTRIQGRITDCVGITAVLRPMTPNEFLHCDVLHCADDNSELEDPEDTIVEEAADEAEAARDRARRASAEWLERRAEFEAMMAARSETTTEATATGPDEIFERGTGSASSSGNRVATPQPKTSRKQASHLLSFALKHRHSPVPILATYSGDLTTLADKLRLSLLRCPHCLGDSRAILFTHSSSLHTGRSLPPELLSRKTVSAMLPLDAQNEYSIFGCSSLLKSSMLARYNISTSWTMMAGPSSHLLLALLGIAVQVVVIICARCLQLCHTVLPGQVQHPAHILNTAVLTWQAVPPQPLQAGSVPSPAVSSAGHKHSSFCLFGCAFAVTLRERETQMRGLVLLPSQHLKLPRQQQRSRMGCGRPASLRLVTHKSPVALNDPFVGRLQDPAEREALSTRAGGDRWHGSQVRT